MTIRIPGEGWCLCVVDCWGGRLGKRIQRGGVANPCAEVGPLGFVPPEEDEEGAVEEEATWGDRWRSGKGIRLT